jgi:hypothetical protein
MNGADAVAPAICCNGPIVKNASCDSHARAVKVLGRQTGASRSGCRGTAEVCSPANDREAKCADATSKDA